MSAAALSSTALISIEEARRYVWRDEDDSSRDEILIDNINDISASVIDELEREFLSTEARTGSDGVTNGTTTFTSASAAFVTADVGRSLRIGTKGLYTIVSRTNATTVVLSGSPSTGTALSWALGVARTFPISSAGRIDLSPYELRSLAWIDRYTDRDASLQETLTTDQWRLDYQTAAGTYLFVKVPAPTLGEAEAGFGWQATIIGSWGMTSVPASVKFAAKIWLDNIVKNPGAFATHAMSGYTVTPEIEVGPTLAGMPPSVRHRLERWRRPRIFE